MNFRRNLISSAAAVVLSLALIPAASAQTVLKASDVHPAGYPNVVSVQKWPLYLAMPWRQGSFSTAVR